MTEEIKPLAEVVECKVAGYPPISKPFSYHKPSEDGQFKIKSLRQAYTRLEHTLCAVTPLSRERAVALTELETSAMWAIKSVVLNDPASTIE